MRTFFYGFLVESFTLNTFKAHPKPTCPCSLPPPAPPSFPRTAAEPSAARSPFLSFLVAFLRLYCAARLGAGGGKGSPSRQLLRLGGERESWAPRYAATPAPHPRACSGAAGPSLAAREFRPPPATPSRSGTTTPPSSPAQLSLSHLIPALDRGEGGAAAAKRAGRGWRVPTCALRPARPSPRLGRPWARSARDRGGGGSDFPRGAQRCTTRELCRAARIKLDLSAPLPAPRLPGLLAPPRCSQAPPPESGCAAKGEAACLPAASSSPVLAPSTSPESLQRARLRPAPPRSAGRATATPVPKEPGHARLEHWDRGLPPA